MKTLLLDAGNLPVARTGKKDNQALYASTFDVFKLGECVAVFPEGTSVNEPATLPLKDGISWVSLTLFISDLYSDNGYRRPHSSMPRI